MKYGFTSTRMLEQNPEYSEEELAGMLEDYFNTEELIFLEELENTGGGIWGHVDMYVKIIDFETIMVSEYPEYVPDYELIESIADYLGSLTNHFGEIR
ncbi:MAG: agmatine deiminase family protein [Bacteroidales bacterium]|nr:agmatine deiminase family protein [Bacteroidales bacterium]MCF8332802.1 agmatine deiminase family protein [Bacteroidales bacterium]